VDFVLGVVAAVDEIFPLAEIGLGGVDMEVLENEHVEAFVGKAERHLVDGGDGGAR